MKLTIITIRLDISAYIFIAKFHQKVQSADCSHTALLILVSKILNESAAIVWQTAHAAPVSYDTDFV